MRKRDSGKERESEKGVLRDREREGERNVGIRERKKERVRKRECA